LRPPGPKPGALAKLSHTPYFSFASASVLPATQELLYGKHRILSTTFFIFFKKLFSHPQSLYFAALRVF
ncbi:hypothetical protein, partial [Eubacterium ramulus]|uniref:hypothetical protein n=1 Tax=Eubacterium ramulus TaxID=39490 RepID=UPI00241E0DA8